MAAEDEVRILRNKRILQEIREKETENARQPGAGVSNGYAQGGDNSIKPNEGRTESSQRTDGRSDRPSNKSGRTSDRHDERIRQAERQGQHPPQEPTASNRRSEEHIRFQLRNPFGSPKQKEPVKLFSKAEAEAELERMTEIYFRGSSLLDDILEIIVKGHQPVQIWQLEEEDAVTLATIHLARAQHDRRSAESARSLLALYDRLYMWMLAVPRVKATYTHVHEQGGFSFR